MKVSDDLESKLLATATSVYVARAGELVPSISDPTRKEPFDHNHAVDEAARLINAVVVRGRSAFERAARETQTASLSTASH